MWHLATGKPVRSFPASDHGARAMCLSPDGTTLVTAGDEGLERRVRIWDVAQGSTRFVSDAIKEEYVWGLRFARDGRSVMGWFNGKLITVWDTLTGQASRSSRLADYLSKLDLSPDGAMLVVGLQNNETLLLDVASGATLRQHGGTSFRIRDVAFSPEGGRLLVGAGTIDQPGTATMWDLTSGTKIRELSPGLGEIDSVAWSADGRYAATDCGPRMGKPGQNPTVSNGGLVIWDATTGSRIRDYAIRLDAAVTFTPDHLVVFGNNSHLDLCDVASGAKRLTTAGHSGNSRVFGNVAAAFSPDGTLVVTGDSSFASNGIAEHVIDGANAIAADPAVAAQLGEVIVWEAATGRQLRRLSGHMAGILAIGFSPDGRRAVTGSWDRTAGVWDVASGARLLTLGGHRNGVYAVAYSPDGKWIATSSGLHKQAGDVHVWNATTGERSFAFTQHNNIVGSLAFSPDSRLLVSGDWNGTAVVWDTSTWAPVRTFAAHSETATVRFSPDGQRILTAGEDGTVKLWDTASGALVQTLSGHAGSVSDAAFSPDGSKFATVSADHTVGVWDAKTLARLLLLDAVAGWTPSVSFRADGRVLLTGDVCRAAAWDATSGRRLQVFEAQTWGVTAVAVSPDGQLAASGGNDALVAIWHLKTGLLLRSLRGHEARIRCVRFSPDGDRLLTSSLDGTVRLWDVATGDELACLITLDGGKDWLAVTPEGYFDGSPGGRTKVAFRIGGGLNVVAVDRFFQDFYRPGLLAEARRGARPLPELRMSRGMPPRLKIVRPQAGDVPTAEATIDVEAADQGAGIANLAIYQNGARVLAPGQSRAEGKTVHRSFTVALVEGQNRLKITASSADGSWEAEPAELVLTYERPLARSRLFLVAIGVNRYADANLSLKYAARRRSLRRAVPPPRIGPV